ncbi:MAG: hypothetical protein ACKVUS_21720 [Saprospiraceae bacterium]
MNKKRRSIMEGTRKNLQAELERACAALNLHSLFSKTVFDLLEKQSQKLSIRGPFIKMVYEYVVEQAKLEGIEIQSFDDKLFHTQLPLVLEGVICVQYYENQILDGKGGVLKEGQPDLNKIRLNLLAGHYLKDFLYDYAAKSVFPTDWSRREVLCEGLRKMFQFVDMGQFAEQKWSNLQNFREGLPELPVMSDETEAFLDHDLITEFWKQIKAAGVDASKEQFVRFYLRRVYLTGAAMFVLGAELVMDLLGYRGVERERLRRFAGHYGMMCQFVNDNNDFMPAEFGHTTVAKDAEDAFSDMRNDNITLPMFFFFQEHPDETCENLMKLPGMEICKRLEDARKRSVILTAEIADGLDDYLPISANPKSISNPLKNLKSMAFRSRYLSDFKKM